MSSFNPPQSFQFPAMSMEATKQPKSPKSPKTLLENPLLKNPSFSLGPNAAAMPPLPPYHPNSAALSLPESTATLPVEATPGPPPKASLSLGMSIAEPMQPLSPPRATQRTLPPMTSPPMLSDEIDTEKTSDDANETWVIAFGHRTESERNAVIDSLREHGHIVRSHTNDNWVAAQYEDRWAATCASCRQLIRLPLSSGLFGVVRATPQLLQELLSQPPSVQNSTASGFLERQSGEADSALGQKPLYREEDILATPRVVVNGRSTGQSSARRPMSICEKLCMWYFGWEHDTTKKHQD